MNVLSNPHVMTSENKKAVINVSDSIPIVTTQQVPIGAGAVPSSSNTTTAVVGTQTVEYRDAGVILTVTPRIGERGTATRNGRESFATIFGGYFVDAMTSDAADADKNKRVSVLEAFDYARREVATAYERQGLIQIGRAHV